MAGDSGLNHTASATIIATTAQNSITASTLTIVIALALSLITLLTIRNKLFSASVKKKLFKLTLCGMLLFAICSSVLISTVRADTVFPQSSARIYGALNGGNGSPAQLQQEKDAAYWVQGQISSAFSSSGYSSIDNAVGPRTTWANEVNNAYYDSTGYDRFAVFHFGHLADFGAGYVDNTGNPIWYSDISPRTTSATKAFVFLWVCAQAQWGPTNNEVQAWMHNPNLSANGYSSPDSGSKAFIGFTDFSPLISDVHQNFQQQWTLPSKYFLKYFYDNALLNGYSIRDAINQASISFFGTTYTNSIFNTGYLAWYPNDGQWHAGSMKIYGNGATFLFQPRFTFATNIPASVTFTVNGRQVGLGSTNLWNTGIYTISANNVPGYTLDHIDYGGQTVGNPFTIQANGNKVITAYYTSSQPYVSTSATADVAITPSAAYTSGTSPTISWVAADDYGAYYCYITDVYVDGVWHNPNDYGNIYTGSITFNNINSDHNIVVYSAPYYYPVTFNQYAHNDNFGDTLVNSWTEYRVAWEERDGPVYSHGSDLHGGGPVSQYVDYSINDPWGWGTDYFNYAYIPNWGGGSEQWCYSIPFDVWTFTWGNTVDIWYNWQEWYGMNGMPSNMTNTDAPSQPTAPTYPANFTPPASTPYIYNATTNTYTPVK